MNSSFVWKNCLEGVVQHISPQHFATWFQPIRVVGGDDGSLELEVPNRFFLEWIKEHYQPLIEDVLRKGTEKEYSLNWKIAEEEKKAPARKGISKARSVSSSRVQRGAQAHGLSPKYTFDSFVVGKTNEFAHAACFAVTKHLASKYNPLFIYGDVGLGKTHLLQAIGNRALHATSGIHVCYYTSERFMNEFINYVSRHKMTDFRRKFRNVDLLLIDDIQFWAGKERTQEEFFHTFNALHEAHKQIVVTSDKFPKDIAGIEERLRSRFEWGLVADIQPPDIETKIAILKNKALAEGIKLPDDVSRWLASVSNSNIRELEGYLNRVLAVSSLTGQDISLDMSKEALKNLTKEKEAKGLSIELVQKAVCAFFNVKLSDLRSKKRHRAIALPRQIAMFIARQYGNFSYPEIGSSFGGKDHSTAIHAVKKIEVGIKENPDLRRTVMAIKNSMGVN
ncbi:MAG: chromosomal replication initiator protein DnaA [Thermodesulfobacteriota bacterium]